MAIFDGDILQHNKFHHSETQTWDVSGQILPEETGDKSERGSSAQRTYEDRQGPMGSDGCVYVGE